MQVLSTSTALSKVRRMLCSAVTASLCWAALQPTVLANGPESHAEGTLVICGGGDLPPAILQQFLELAGGREARLVVVTTASETAGTPRVERYLRFWRQQELASLTVLHTRSREEANSPQFCSPLADATGVWFIGGDQGKLVDTYLDTATRTELQAVLRRGGVIGGTSAGAAIMSPVMIRRGQQTPEIDRGFGFLPGTVIDQHFLKRNRLPRLLQALTDHPKLVGIGIDEGTALVVQGNRMTVLGESQVLTCLAAVGDEPPVVRALSAGTEIIIAELQKAASERLTRLTASATTP